MKKLLLLPIIIIFLNSCGYRKNADVYSGDNDEESYYVVRVFAPTFTNSPPIKTYSLPMEGINDFKVDSINKEADKYIENCEKYTNN